MQRSTRAVYTQNGPLTPCTLSTVHSSSVCSAPSTHPVHAQRSPLTLCVLSAVHSHSACSASSTHPVRAQHRPLTPCALSTVHSSRVRSARSTRPVRSQHLSQTSSGYQLCGLNFLFSCFTSFIKKCSCVQNIAREKSDVEECTRQTGSQRGQELWLRQRILNHKEGTRHNGEYFSI